MDQQQCNNEAAMAELLIYTARKSSQWKEQRLQQVETADALVSLSAEPSPLKKNKTVQPVHILMKAFVQSSHVITIGGKPSKNNFWNHARSHGSSLLGELSVYNNSELIEAYSEVKNKGR